MLFGFQVQLLLLDHLSFSARPDFIFPRLNGKKNLVVFPGDSFYDNHSLLLIPSLTLAVVQDPGWHALSSISWFRFDYFTIAWEALLAPNGQRQSPFFMNFLSLYWGSPECPNLLGTRRRQRANLYLPVSGPVHGVYSYIHGHSER